MPSRFRVLFACLLVLSCGPTRAQILLDAPDLDLRTEGTVRALARLADGTVIVGGQFQSIDGMPRANIARLLPDGSVDPAWAPQIDGAVLALTLASDGAIIAGGGFTRVNGISLPYLAKLADGSGAPVAAWRPAPDGYVWALAVAGFDLYVGGSFSQLGGAARASIGRVSTLGNGTADAWNPSANGTVHALSVMQGQLSAPDAIFAGGTFTQIGGLARNRIARLSEDSSGANASWNPSMDGSVLALANDGNSIFAGGSFSTVGGAPLARLVRLPGVGSGIPAAGFAPQPDLAVHSLSLLGATLYVGGQFGTIGGQTRAGVARMSAGSGAVDAGWNPGAPGSEVYAVRGRSDGIAYVGGRFRRCAGAPRLSLARVDADGGSLVATDAAYKGRVAALARQADGGLIVGGEFAFADGVPRGNLLRLDAAGQLDPLWAPETDGDIVALAIDGAGRVLAAGQFNRVSGLPLRGIARLAGSGDGAPDAGWNAAPDYYVRAVAIQADGEVVVGGSFTSIGGLPRNRLARLSAANAAADPGWNPDADDWVYSLAVAADGTIIVGGSFTAIGGQPRTSAARLAASDGAASPGWNLALDGGVDAVALSPDAAFVYLGGYFTQVAGQARPGGIARVHLPTGALDATWVAPLSGTTTALAVDERGEVYAGGSLSMSSGPQRFLYRLAAADGALSPGWQYATDAATYEVLLHAGRAWVAGAFTSALGQPRVGVAGLIVDRLFVGGFDG